MSDITLEVTFKVKEDPVHQTKYGSEMPQSPKQRLIEEVNDA